MTSILSIFRNVSLWSLLTAEMVVIAMFLLDMAGRSGM